MTNKGWKALKRKRWCTRIHVFLFLCSVATGLPNTTKAPPPSQKWVRGKQVGGEAYIACEWKLTLNDHSTIEETVALIQGAF